MNSTAAVALVVMVAAGLAFVALGLRAVREGRKAEAPPDSKPTGAPDPAEPAPLQLVATLGRDEAGNLTVEVDGNRYSSQAEVESDAIRARLEAASRDLEALLHPPTPVAPEPVEPTPVAPASDDAAGATFLATQQTVASDAGVESAVKKVSLEEAARLPLEKPSMSVLGQWRKLKKREAAPRIEVKTFIEEIDEVLQARLGHSTLAGRGLCVRANPETGAAQFELDGKAYADVDDVPEATARELIRASIAEWEAR